MLGSKVSAARKKYKVDLPTMYAVSSKDGDDAHMFNCVQRGHQQALETLPSFFLFSMIGGIRHPLVVAACGILWSYARPKWAEGYATGKPESRYTHKAAVLVWTCLLIPMVCTVSTGLGILGIV